jgi:hypothetical protein
MILELKQNKNRLFADMAANPACDWFRARRQLIRLLQANFFAETF